MKNSVPIYQLNCEYIHESLRTKYRNFTIVNVKIIPESFYENIMDVLDFCFPKIERVTRENRKIQYNSKVHKAEYARYISYKTIFAITHWTSK